MANKLNVNSKLIGNKFLIEYYDCGTRTISANDSIVWSSPLKDGYTPYVLKVCANGSWADKFAAVIPWKDNRSFGVKNLASTSYTWEIGAYILYVKD